MSKSRVLVFDDDISRAKVWKKRLTPAIGKLPFAVEVPDTRQFQDAVDMLERRRIKARDKVNSDSCTLFDDLAILIIDYDLLKTRGLSGERVAYLARCYSSCGLIVAVNQYSRTSVFDMTLRGHPESFADLNVSDRDIDNPGLWGDGWTGFRPWVWPILPLEYDRFLRRVRAVEANLDNRILWFLEFPEELVVAMPRSVVEFLEGNESAQETTFRDFVEGSPNCLDPRDEIANSNSLARVAAARVSKWLERLVLPGQDFLVDAPHLISRFPSLLAGDRHSMAAWNSAVRLGDPKGRGLRTKPIAHFAFRRKEWLSRAAWYWPLVSSSTEIDEVRDPWSVWSPEWVFCEDVSRFVPEGVAREFAADLQSPFNRRHVVDAASTYARQHFPVLQDVAYRPIVRFSL